MKQLTVILIICLGSLNIAFAQTTPISFCGKIQVVDKKLEKKLNLFPEYTQFMQANLFQEGDHYILEIVHELNNQIKVERKKLVQADLDVICTKINSKISKSKINTDSSFIDQSGRRELLVTSTVLGLGAYGWMIPASTDMDTRASIATYMVVSAGSFFIPFGLTQDKKITRGMARSYGWGSALGIAHGAILQNMVQDVSRTFEGQFLPSLAGGLVEGALLYTLASKNDWDRGMAGMIGTGGTWGLGLGLGLGSLIISQDLSLSNAEKNLVFGMGMLSSGLGMYSGYLWANKNGSVSNGDVIMTTASGLLGVSWGNSISSLWEDYFVEDKLSLTTVILTAAGGITYGLYRTSNYDYSSAEGVYITLGAASGGLLGFGLAYLFTDELSLQSARWSSTIGGTIGFGLVDYLIRKNDVKVNPAIGNWSFDLNPMGFSSNFDANDTNIDMNRLQNASHAVKARLTF